MYRDPVRLGNQQVRPIQRGTTSALLPSASGHVHAEKLLTWEAGNTKTLSELTADTIGVGLGNHHFILEAGSAPRDGLTCGERTDGNESASCSYTGATGIDQYGSRGGSKMPYGSCSVHTIFADSAIASVTLARLTVRS